MRAFSKDEVCAANSKIPIRTKGFKAGLRRALRNPAAWIVLAALLVAGTTAFMYPRTMEAFAVKLDGAQVALVLEKDQAEKIFEQAKADLSEQVEGEPVWENKLEVAAVQVPKDQVFTESSELYSLLKRQLSFNIMATALEVNGKTKAVLNDKLKAQQVLDTLKEQFVPQQEGIELESLAFEERVELVPVEAEEDEIMTVDEAVNLLATGEKVVKQHVVKEGDSLWIIARANDLWVEDLLAANPGITEDSKLQPGASLKLVQAEPSVHVVATYKVAVLEKIPYRVQVKEDESLWRGQERVEQWGQYGEKEVEYRIVRRNNQEMSKDVLEEEILKEPEKKIVRRGTKMMIASRGDGGNGQLAWPLRGVITSDYGYRGREFHTGLDIDGKTGDPVFAAEGGTVIFAGWQGNYGYMVTIDHGDGLQTRYAHNSSLKVKLGQKVSRGSLLALVGSTGRSTGSHLHFEVLVNGDFRNPQRYLD